jgi:hypothetical protein
MDNVIKSKVKHANTAQEAQDASKPAQHTGIEHLFFRIDTVPMTTATGGVIWKASIPQFSSIHSIHANKEIAILTIFEKLPDAFWDVIRNEEKTEDD